MDPLKLFVFEVLPEYEWKNEYGGKVNHIHLPQRVAVRFALGGPRSENGRFNSQVFVLYDCQTIEQATQRMTEWITEVQNDCKL